MSVPILMAVFGFSEFDRLKRNSRGVSVAGDMRQGDREGFVRQG